MSVFLLKSSFKNLSDSDNFCDCWQYSGLLLNSFGKGLGSALKYSYRQSNQKSKIELISFLINALFSALGPKNKDWNGWYSIASEVSIAMTLTHL
ncbi:MAG: hypothetical protein R3B45_13240 [Bdellovibrionota bacterium]